MKKFFSLWVCVLILTGISCASEIKVYLNNNQVSLNGKAVMENGRVLVPMRSIFESLGASVNWDGKNNLITSIKGNTKIALQIGNKNMGLNGKLIALDVAPKIVSGRTLVPIRVISESFGYEVKWDNSVYIVSKNNSSNNFNNNVPIYNYEEATIDEFSWVSPKLPISYAWNENINKKVTITSNRISFIQCTDEVEFRNKIFTSSGWSITLPLGTNVTLIKVGRMYPDTLFVKLDDGTRGVAYQTKN